MASDAAGAGARVALNEVERERIERERIERERDPARLDRWIARATTCSSAAELFAEQ